MYLVKLFGFVTTMNTLKYCHKVVFPFESFLAITVCTVLFYCSVKNTMYCAYLLFCIEHYVQYFSIVLQRPLCTCTLFYKEHNEPTRVLFCKVHNVLASGLQLFALDYCSVENTMYLLIVLQRTQCTCLMFCREHNVLAYCSVENTIGQSLFQVVLALSNIGQMNNILGQNCAIILNWMSNSFRSYEHQSWGG